MDTAVFSTSVTSPLTPAVLPPGRYIDLAPLPPARLFFLDVNNRYGEEGNLVALVSEDAAIKAQINNILSTPIGSEVFEPEYGSMLPWRIMEPINSNTAWLIETDTIIAVKRWMGNRILVDRSQCYVRPLENEEGYAIYLLYQILRTKTVVEWNFSIYR